jgi:DnaJ-class molecular chaperone
MIDAYKTLGVTKSATQDEVKSAYRKLAKKLHPDLNPGNKEAEKKFKEVNKAYDMIGTPEQRAKYDRGEFDEQNPPPHGAWSGRSRGRPFYYQTQQDGGRYSSQFDGIDEDFLNSIFGHRGGRGRGFSSGFDETPQDALYQMDVDFKDAALGAEREITLPTGRRLQVKIPAGVESGTKLRIPGKPAGGQAQGDVYILLNVKPSKLFKREGNNVEMELPISLSEAVLGGEVRTPTLDGSILLRVPPNSSSGRRLRVPGKGIVDMKTRKRGDQLVTLRIVLPPNVDPEVKRAIEESKSREPFDPRAQWESEI